MFSSTNKDAVAEAAGMVTMGFLYKLDVFELVETRTMTIDLVYIILITTTI